MPSLPRPGDRLAGFRIERELGHGTTGVVFLAQQEALDRRVALKVVGLPLAADAAFRERFRREARAVAGLDHPNVVQILETGEDDAHLWLAMRLVDGPDLRVLLRRTGRLDPEQAVAVVEQVAAALDAAHAAGLVHRDVKPGNVLIEDGPGRDLHVELADFGLARAPGVDDAEGTPGYAAPEQLAGTEAGPAADVFALGCVLFELLTGAAPPAPAPAPDGNVPWRRGAGAGDDPGTETADLEAGDGVVGDAEDEAGAPEDDGTGTEDDGTGTEVRTAGAAAAAAYATLLPLTPSAALPRLGGAFDPAVQRATAADPAARFASAGEFAMWARAALTVPRVAPEPTDPVRIAAASPASPAEVGPAAPTWEIPPTRRRRRRGRTLLVALFLAMVLALLGTAFVFIGSLGDSSRDRQTGTTPGAPTPAGGGGSSSAGGSGSGNAGAGSAGSGGTGGSSAGGTAPGAGAGGSRAGGGSGSGAGSGAAGGGRAGSGGGGAAGAGGSGTTAGGSGAGAAGADGAGTRANGTGGSGAGGAGGRGTGRTGAGRPGAGGTNGAAGDSGAGSGSSGGAGSGGAASGGGGSRGPGTGVPDAAPRAPRGAATAPLPPVPAGSVRFGGGNWVLDLPAAEGWRQTATQELDGGSRLVTRLLRPDAVRLIVESLPGRTAVVATPGARAFPVRLPDAGRTDGALYRGGRYAMCADGVCAALPANGPNGGVLLIVGARSEAGAKRVARRAAAGLRVR